MEWHAVALVLLAALLHATWNAFVKASGDRLVTLGLVNAGRFAVCVVAVFFLPIPHADSWPFLVLSAALHVGYYLFLIKAYGSGDLSHVYPLARGVSPLLIAGGALLLADERLGSGALLGVVIVSLGIASLTFITSGDQHRSRQAVYYALATAVFIAAYTVTDGMGVRRAGSVIAYIAWLTVLDGFPILCLAVLRRRGRFLMLARESFWRACSGGLLQLLAYGLVIWAMSFSPMAGISALRETSVIFAAMIGAYLLKEPLGRKRIGAAALVATGIVIMKLF
jgi:drug/metabolite transporter (DMT)-like permease